MSVSKLCISFSVFTCEKLAFFKYPFSRSPLWFPDSEVFVPHVHFRCFCVNAALGYVDSSSICSYSVGFMLLCSSLVMKAHGPKHLEVFFQSSPTTQESYVKNPMSMDHLKHTFVNLGPVVAYKVVVMFI